MTLAVLIRAHQFAAQEALLAERLEAAFGSRVYFVTDDSEEPVSTGRFCKIGINRRQVRLLRGGSVGRTWGWQQGDVFFYAARAALPEAMHFAMIESDVFLSKAAADQLATLFTTREEEVLAVRLGRRAKPHSFAKDLEVLGEDTLVTCFFPVARVSARVVDRMQALRRRATQQPELRLNDEAILAAVALKDDVSSANLSEIAPELFDPTCFTLERTQLFEFHAESYDGVSALHPVRNMNALLQRINEIGSFRDLRTRFQEAIEQAQPRQKKQLERALAAAKQSA
ncbi:MAG: hypothetical protein HKN27_04790 [Silicimonas sp.]|nr:hypothetical protein [Silicimonas sp.]